MANWIKITTKQKLQYLDLDRIMFLSIEDGKYLINLEPDLDSLEVDESTYHQITEILDQKINKQEELNKSIHELKTLGNALGNKIPSFLDKIFGDN